MGKGGGRGEEEEVGKGGGEKKEGGEGEKKGGGEGGSAQCRDVRATQKSYSPRNIALSGGQVSALMHCTYSMHYH